MHFLLFIRQHFVPLILASLIAAIVFLLFVDVSWSGKRTIEKERITPYVLCTKGKIIVRKGVSESITLGEQERADIWEDDRIRTLAGSAGTIFWADGSVTRLWEKTNVSLNELRTSPNGSTQVDFSLTEWKTWTHISRALDPESSFKERFDNNQKVAAVRGTVFDINTERNYIHTTSHAIAIQDEKWAYITSVPAGKSVGIQSVFEGIDPKQLDESWQALNKQEDFVLVQQRLQHIEATLKQFQKQTKLEAFQNWLREKIGLAPFGLPLSIEQNGSWAFILTLDVQRLQSQDVPKMLALYEKLSGLSNSPETIDAKTQLRSALLQKLPEKEAQKYAEAFARATLFDSWDALSGNLPESTKELRKSLEIFVGQSGNLEEITRIQESLPPETTRAFSEQIEIWKSRGIEMLSDAEWFKKTFKIDTESIQKNIQDFNAGIDSILKR